MRALALGIVVIVAVLAEGCVPRQSARSDATVRAILAVLEEDIARNGSVTRLIAPPVRPYQHRASDAAVAALGELLHLPAAVAGEPLPSCRWAPVDSSAVGMAITVTEFEVVGDSARVSILRACRQRDGARVGRYELEPTWTLRRRDGRWSVVSRVIRVTEGLRPRFYLTSVS